MNFYIAGQTDVGIVKSTNQDSLLVKKITTDYGGMVFAILCDGMGGLAKGELASATVIRAFDEWAQNELPLLGQNGHIDDMSLKNQWERIILEQNVKIKNYGMSIGVNIGTTAVILLVLQWFSIIMSTSGPTASLAAFTLASNSFKTSGVSQFLCISAESLLPSASFPVKSILTAVYPSETAFLQASVKNSMLPGAFINSS